jgi:hypothetical protein
MPSTEDGSFAGAPIHRDDAEPDSGDTRDLLETRGDLFVGRHHLLRIGISVAGRRARTSPPPSDARSQADLSHGDKRPSHQAGDRQQHNGKRDLSHDERIPHAVSPGGGARRPTLQQLCAEPRDLRTGTSQTADWSQRRCQE